MARPPAALSSDQFLFGIVGGEGNVSLGLEFTESRGKRVSNRMVRRAAKYQAQRRTRLVGNHCHCIGHAFGIPGDDPTPGVHGVTCLVGGRVVIDCYGFRLHKTTPEVGARRPRLDKSELDTERYQFLGQRLDKPSMPHLVA